MMYDAGIPPSLRGRVWQALIGGHLHIAPDMYEDYMKVTRAHMHADIHAHTRPHMCVPGCAGAR